MGWGGASWRMARCRQQYRLYSQSFHGGFNTFSRRQTEQAAATLALTSTSKSRQWDRGNGQ
jgi:hypothetical protein